MGITLTGKGGTKMKSRMDIVLTFDEKRKQWLATHGRISGKQSGNANDAIKTLMDNFASQSNASWEAKVIHNET